MKIEDVQRFSFADALNTEHPDFRVTTFDAEVLHLVHGQAGW
jgi:hypothetical protein